MAIAAATVVVCLDDGSAARPAERCQLFGDGRVGSLLIYARQGLQPGWLEALVHEASLIDGRCLSELFEVGFRLAMSGNNVVERSPHRQTDPCGEEHC